MPLSEVDSVRASADRKVHFNKLSFNLKMAECENELGIDGYQETREGQPI
jgi:hypothetical protein